MYTSHALPPCLCVQYTPEHMHCFATFYGPLVPPNTGLLAIQSLSGQQAGFRVSATGVVLEFDASFPVCKKLKLVGYPSKVFKNTAFVRSMFGSDLEVFFFGLMDRDRKSVV